MNDILYFILHIGLSLLGFAFLLRAWLFFIRMPPFNPYSIAIIQVTDWANRPLRKWLAPKKRIDWPNLLAAWLCAIVFLLGSWLLIMGAWVPLDMLPKLLISAVFTVIKWMLNIALWAVILQAIMSWVNPNAPAMAFVYALTSPIIEPVRRRMPSTGAIDFSPLVVLLIIQVLSMLTQRISLSLISF